MTGGLSTSGEGSFFRSRKAKPPSRDRPMGTVSNLKQIDCFKEEKDKEEEKRARASRTNFDWFWSEYPKKKAKLEALKAWKETESIRPDIEQVIAALDTQKNSMDWQRDGGAYVPHPATWLRQGRWDDE